jgi:hypothetical protein
MDADDAGLLPVDPLDVLRRRRSVKWQTYPADVLPLTVAEMDFALAPPVADVLREAVQRSDAGYAHAVPDLGRAIAGFAARRWNWDLDPAAVTAVTDVGVGVVELLRAATRPGDAVVISPPVYPPFFDWVPEAGARILEVPLAHGADGWHLDLAGLEAAFATHPAAYVLCNPHNPVGRVHTADELAALVRLDDVALDWPPQAVPPLLIGARGPRTIALAGEIADGLVLDAGITPDGVRRAVAMAAAARPHEVVVYLLCAAGPGAKDRAEAELAAAPPQPANPSPAAPAECAAVGSAADVAHIIGTYARAGATTVVLQPTADDPDVTETIKLAGQARTALHADR